MTTPADHPEPPDAILPTKRCWKWYGKRPHAALTVDRVPHVYRCPGWDETDATEPAAGPTDTSEALTERLAGLYSAGGMGWSGLQKISSTLRAELAEKDREIERLRGDIEMGRTNLAHYREQIDAMAGQVARVRALHVRTATEYGPDYCRGCSDLAHEWVQWPCPTGAALEVPAGPPLHEPTDRDGGNIPTEGGA